MSFRTRAHVAVLVLLLPLAGGCRAQELPQSTSDLDTRSSSPDWSVFTLGPSDRVHLGVFGQPDFGLPEDGIRVAPDGTLSVPLLGAVDVLGLTAEEARQTIEAGLSEFLREPAVVLSVLEYSSRRFYLFGEIKKPGEYTMDRPLTALAALTRGEGFLGSANRENVVVVRAHVDEEVEVIPFNAETPGPDGLVQIRPNDFIFVGRSGPGRFSDEILPYLQGTGFTLSQIASIILTVDRVKN